MLNGMKMVHVMMIYKILYSRLPVKNSQPFGIESHVGGERFYDSNDHVV